MTARRLCGDMVGWVSGVMRSSGDAVSVDSLLARLHILHGLIEPEDV